MPGAIRTGQLSQRIASVGHKLLSVYWETPWNWLDQRLIVGYGAFRKQQAIDPGVP